MGYTTDFVGEFKLNKPLMPKQMEYLTKFSETRRMKRSEVAASKMEDPVREAVKLPVGHHGEYFVGGLGFFGQDNDDSVLDYNSPPPSQPGLWCQWEPNDGGTAIVWNQGEKFYYYIEWLQYIITHFLRPWGYTLNGEVTWQGEEHGDIGMITVKDNEIST